MQTGNAKGMRTFAILGYSGGRCRAIAQHSVHFAIDDMQIAEDLQLIVGHICVQWLHANPLRRVDQPDGEHRNARKSRTPAEARA
jgi:D-sedoheptulose 7-phosphate isomerase